MSLSMYQASVPVLSRVLNNLSSILEKAEAHAEAKKIDQAVFINARLSARYVRAGPSGADRHRYRKRLCRPAGR